jgi:hypothetical protein
MSALTPALAWELSRVGGVAVAVSMLGGLVNEPNAGDFKSNRSCSQSKPHFRPLAKVPHSHRSSVSSDTLPLSHLKLDVRGLLVWHI